MNAADQMKVAAFTTYTVWMSATASRSPPSAGPRKKPTLSIVLEATLAAVEFADVTRQPGKQCRLRRTKARAHERRRDRQPVHRERGAVGSDDDSRHEHERSTEDVRDEHHPLAWVAVGEGRRERQYERHREVPSDAE